MIVQQINSHMLICLIVNTQGLHHWRNSVTLKTLLFIGPSINRCVCPRANGMSDFDCGCTHAPRTLNIKATPSWLIPYSSFHNGTSNSYRKYWLQRWTVNLRSKHWHQNNTCGVGRLFLRLRSCRQAGNTERSIQWPMWKRCADRIFRRCISENGSYQKWFHFPWTEDGSFGGNVSYVFKATVALRFLNKACFC